MSDPKRDNRSDLPTCQKCRQKKSDVKVGPDQPYALCNDCWFPTPAHWKPAR